MKLSNIIGTFLCGAAVFCILTLIIIVPITARYGECYIDEQGYKHCSWKGFSITSKEKVQ